MTLDNWRDDFYTTIEDDSILVDGLDILGKSLIRYNGLVPLNGSFLCFYPINKMVRVPARVGGIYHNNIGLANGGFSSNYYLVSNGFYGKIFSSSTIYNNTSILPYMPRMYVQLQKLSEFISDIGLNNHYVVNPILNAPTASYSYGYKYRRLSAIPENLYVLKSYSIYTNKADGTSQTQLANYTYTSRGYETPTIIDTFIPCNSFGGYCDKGSTDIAYMRSLIPHYYVGGDSLAKYTFLPPLYVGMNGIAINMCSTIDKDSEFSANPFMNTGSAVYYKEYWATLTTAPTGGDLISYIAADLSTWKQLFTASGMPWSDNIDDVIKPDDDDLNKPTTPGLPSNPIIDDDGPGSNKTDPVDYPEPKYIPNSTVYDRYFLSPNQMPDIKKFLFSDTFIDNIKRLWTNPAEYVISLVCYPFDVANTGLGTTNDVVSIGGVASGIVATALTDRGVPYFYGGSVLVDNYYNSYLDYEPYTSIDIYIPYIGVRPLNVSQVVGHTLCIGYYIDLNTQQITALLGLDGQNGNLGQVLTQYVGSIGVQAPLSGTSAQDMIRNIVAQTSGLITGIGAIAGGVMGANPALLTSGVSKTSNEILGGGHTAPSYYGSLSPVSGLFTPQMAYLIINRPRQAIPTAYLSQRGFSSSFSGKVSEFSGYLECTSVYLSSANTMSEQEQQEITNLLIGGIYI